MGFNLLINGVYWGYNPFTKLLLTSWDILVEIPQKMLVELVAARRREVVYSIPYTYLLTCQKIVESLRLPGVIGVASLTHIGHA